MTTDRRLVPQPWQANYIPLRTLRRQLSRAIDEHLVGRIGLEVLDAGCGSRPYESLFDGVAGRYVGLDVSPGEGVDVVGTAEELPFPDASFDCVLSSQVLEHVVDPRIVLQEMHRVLRPGGLALLSTHGVVRYHATPDRRPDDYRRWTHAGLAVEFELAGAWSSIDVRPNGGAAGALAFLVGREAEIALGLARAAWLSRPLQLGLNAAAWQLDLVAARRFPGRTPDIVSNFLVVAVR